MIFRTGVILLHLFFLTTVSTKAANIELEAYEQIVELMDKHYFDASYSGLNWAQLTTQIREEISAEKSSPKKYKLIQKLFANLKHSHLVFNPPTLQKKKKINIPTGRPRNLDFEVEWLEGYWTIIKVKKSSPAWESGLRPAMRILKFNQWDAQSLYRDEGTMAYYYMRNMLHTYPSSKIVLTVLDANEETIKISFKLNPFTGKYQKMGLIRDAAEFEQRLLPGNIGYVRFSIFLVKPVQQAIAAIKKFRDQKVKGMIIDLRNNPGGIAMLATAIAKEFCTKNYNLGIQTGRAMTLKFPVFAQAKPYTGKVVLLLNKNSASTSEVLAAGMQTHKTVQIVGENSAGMALPSVMVSLKDGSVFQYPIADFKTVDGKTIEGIGVKPEKIISHSQASLKLAKDAFIEAAIQLIDTKEK
jgi:C-terminal peptidase prc